jgi:redox-sensing transcriptional repressor
VAQRIPTATVARLSRYLAVVEGYLSSSISSEDLAVRAGSNSAQVRKDMSHLGAPGTRGVGYDTEKLVALIRRALGLGAERGVVIVGAGNLGRALAGYPGFARRGFRICGLFDISPGLVGIDIAGHRVHHLSELDKVVTNPVAAIGVPEEAAQSVAELLVAVGFRSILNFAPILVEVPPSVEVRQVDMAMELHILSHRLGRAEDELD